LRPTCGLPIGLWHRPTFRTIRRAASASHNTRRSAPSITTRNQTTSAAATGTPAVVSRPEKASITCISSKNSDEQCDRTASGDSPIVPTAFRIQCGARPSPAWGIIRSSLTARTPHRMAQRADHEGTSNSNPGRTGRIRAIEFDRAGRFVHLTASIRIGTRVLLVQSLHPATVTQCPRLPRPPVADRRDQQ
jgi:hypothetical protein